MPASPSDGRGKWRKRKREREPQIRRPKQEEDDDDEEDGEDDHDEDYSDGAHHANQPDPGPMESEVLSDGGVCCSDFPPAVRRAVDRPHQSVLAVSAMERANHYGQGKPSSLCLENISHGQLQALSAVPSDCPGLDQEKDGGSSSYVVTPPPILEGRGVVKRFGSRSHIVPMHSDWFSPATVHRLERQVVPHFFSGKSPEHSPEKYMECRNYIVAKYMENPEMRLAASDFQGLIAGVETEDLNRIHRFLDNWGIINYCAEAPSPELWSGISYLREEPAGEIHVPSAALKSIDSLIKFDKPKCKLKAGEVYPSLSGHDNDISDLDSRLRERLSENHCNYCARPLPSVYYQSHKEVDVMLCTDCFHEGSFVIGHSSLDFARLDSSKDYGDMDGESWTDQETLLLLEAMEMHNENWNEIAEHVGSKSKAQCILHFLRLPVEDGLLENIEVPGIPASSNLSNGDISKRLYPNSNGNSHEQEDDFKTRFPFANSGNPVMAMVAFLASAVGPRVAAACAHASLAALSEEGEVIAPDGQLTREGSGHSIRVNSENMHGRDGGPLGENSAHQKEENSRGQNEAGSAPLSAEKVKAAAQAGLAAAATKAKLFADHEEREIQRLSANIINHQLKRLELKLKQFAEVETFLMKECEQVERTRQRLFSERSRFLATQVAGAPAAASPMSPPAGGPSMVNNNTNSMRPQGMPAPPSQPSISGYGSPNPPQQQVHPHMPYMQRQPMFGMMGPRLPLSALQPSSSAPPNAHFSPQGNPQPGLTRPVLRPVHGAGPSLG